MKLKPVIASYSGETYTKIRNYLDESVLEIIADVAHSPKHRQEIPSDVLRELEAMHVLKESEGFIRLETSVFLENDIHAIFQTVKPLASELSELVIDTAVAFKDAPPEVTIFLAGILGLVQGLGMNIKEKNIAIPWKNYKGKYAQSKVDFDELCDVYDALGPDCLNKTVLQGEKYTAVFIGPGGGSYRSLVQPVNKTDVSQNYYHQINRYLVDAFAMLVKGESQNPSLYAAAEAAQLYQNGKPKTSVVTNEMLKKYQSTIKSMTNITSWYFDSKLDKLVTLLRMTTPGRQGVPPANMMLNLWRYIRKVTAKEMYTSGFFTDKIPEEGTLTVFYANNVEFITKLFA